MIRVACKERTCNAEERCRPSNDEFTALLQSPKNIWESKSLEIKTKSQELESYIASYIEKT